MAKTPARLRREMLEKVLAPSTQDALENQRNQYMSGMSRADLIALSDDAGLLRGEFDPLTRVIENLGADGEISFAVQSPYIDAAKAVAVSNSVPFASVHARYGNDFQVGSDLGYYYDTIHQLEIGYAHQADWMANVILSV